jgi:uncharacterized membrane protein YhaH (DUF805 family)
VTAGAASLGWQLIQWGAAIMNFGEAIKSGFSNYVTFSGRACRSEFWYWTLFAILVTIAAGIIDRELVDSDTGLVQPLVSLALFLPGIAVGIRRLHDLDRSGWWWLIAFTIIGLIVLIVWDCTKGTSGTNRFGPVPLGAG